MHSERNADRWPPQTIILNFFCLSALITSSSWVQGKNDLKPDLLLSNGHCGILVTSRILEPDDSGLRVVSSHAR
ncbi:hypothetical protein F5879DRAFT_957238 [Lentinula edodes]|nr:hypothetical protein F5879DRAFT_957238 [Lentinula edodes]